MEKLLFVLLLIVLTFLTAAVWVCSNAAPSHHRGPDQVRQADPPAVNNQVYEKRR